MKKNIVLFSVFLMFSSPSFSYEKIGEVYEIKEQSMLEYIYQILEQKKKSGEIEKMKEDFIKNAKNTFKNPPGVYLPDADKKSIKKYDPSFVTDKNIYLPDGRVLYPVGTRLNPLSIRPFSKRLIFINGNNEEQVKFAIKLREESGLRDKIILVYGSPFDFMKKHKVRAFFDQTKGENGRPTLTLAKRFQIQNLPAIVYQKHSDDKFLTVEEVPL